jgi:hypothetical protein
MKRRLLAKSNIIKKQKNEIPQADKLSFDAWVAFKDIWNSIIPFAAEASVSTWLSLSKTCRLFHNLLAVPNGVKEAFKKYKLYRDPALRHNESFLWKNILKLNLFPNSLYRHKRNSDYDEIDWSTYKILNQKAFKREDYIFHECKYPSDNRLLYNNFYDNLSITIDSFGMSNYEFEDLTVCGSENECGSFINEYNQLYVDFLSFHYFVDKNDNICMGITIEENVFKFNPKYEARIIWICLMRIYFILQEKNIKCSLEFVNFDVDNLYKYGFNNGALLILRIPRFNIPEEKKKIFENCFRGWQKPSICDRFHYKDGIDFDFPFDREYNSSWFTLSTTNWIDTLIKYQEISIEKEDYKIYASEKSDHVSFDFLSYKEKRIKKFIEHVWRLYCDITGECLTWDEKLVGLYKSGYYYKVVSGNLQNSRVI